MAKWIAAAILAVSLTFAAAIDPVTAAPSPAALQKSQALKATDLGARRRYRARYAYRPYYPTYYDRPYYYAPAPLVPFNFGYPLLPPPWW